ncbi:PucR family transcriptional regulator [Salipaludibacillus keqinensis]|uniref:PucR family transcriptional regulator n=1 Tax=Salipaludibacillus keqinensis TaxID=2045207 RepID=A0A323THY7_9BACI|nr:PucR family transcriptional regulator [Salipaludibacillus keqinensis]PYZ94742.1 PucR family transcriptional regulator [Salipaludibacillus keqinensis]
MKLETLLEKSIFNGAAVISGHEGLKRDVQSVNMMDAPDIIDFLKENQLLLTTAYSIKNRPEALLELVEKMAKQGCAGLGLKIQRFLKVIPADVIALANELDFPIIELPVEPSLGEVVNESLKLILEERTEELHYALDIHRKFSDIIISGKGLYEVIDRLAKVIQSPVVLMNHRLETIAASKKYGEDFYYEIAYQINEELKVRDITSQEKLLLKIQFPHIKERQMATVFPVQTNVYQKGYLIVFKEIPEETSASVLAIEQAANVTSFELMKIHAVEQNARILKNEFLTDFVEGNYSSEKDIAKRGKFYNLKSNHHYICISSKLDKDEDLYSGLLDISESHMQMYKDSIYEQMEVWLRYYFKNHIIFTKGDLYIILVGTEGFTEDPEQQVMEKIKKVQGEIHENLFISMSFGIGNIAEQLLHVPNSYQESLDALRSGFRSRKKQFVQNCNTKGVTELLRTVAPQKLRDFYVSSLKSLAESDRKDEQDLIETLSVYIEKNCQIADTAKELFVHRNTVIYRIRKCEERLNVDLKKAEDIHKLRTALLIRAII